MSCLTVQSRTASELALTTEARLPEIAVRPGSLSSALLSVEYILIFFFSWMLISLKMCGL